MLEGSVKTEAEKKLEEEKVIMDVVAQKNHLASDRELAKGIIYTNPIKTTEHNAIRQSNHILVDGEEIPPPDMKFPPAILKCLKSKGINRHTPTQVKAFQWCKPNCTSILDRMKLLFLSVWKNLGFFITIDHICFGRNKKLPLIRGEGPIGMIVCPSRELARQTYESICAMNEYLILDGCPKLRILLCIGGRKCLPTFETKVHALVRIKRHFVVIEIDDIINEGTQVRNYFNVVLENVKKRRTFGLEDDDDYVPYVPIKQSREAKFQKQASQRRLPEQQNLAEADEGIEDSHKAGPKANAIMDAVAQKKHLTSHRELAKGIIYTNPSIWRPPRHILEAPQREYDAIREKYHILVDGEKIPPPIKHFRLSGLDMIGIAFTGSGKTLAFSIQLMMFALEEEVKLPLIKGEGPIE
ncbi:hypothetical protein C2G38_2171250 [Gigaspora rosea]|uniref:P-loop containing nucleoside triphosphate hydrolase protein n=1 Tax=Gigaspora rosea TaxID=44941 RepID=A0A397VND2_9GLOM|nr:hypothetical protein C2G38_2171250 [Gigaspora rosea]